MTVMTKRDLCDLVDLTRESVAELRERLLSDRSASYQAIERSRAAISALRDRLAEVSDGELAFLALAYATAPGLDAPELWPLQTVLRARGLDSPRRLIDQARVWALERGDEKRGESAREV